MSFASRSLRRESQPTARRPDGAGRSARLGLVAALAAGVLGFGAPGANAEPLIPVPDRKVVSEVSVTKTEIAVKFGFRLRAKAAAAWKIVSKFKTYTKFIDGLQKVKVARKGKTTVLTLQGKMLTDYRIKVRLRSSFSEEKGGEMRWKVLDETPPNTGAMRLDVDGEDVVVTLATRVKRTVDLPDFLILMGLKTAMTAVGEGVRKSVEQAL